MSFLYEGQVEPALGQQVVGARSFLVINRGAEALKGI
jgi:hypothetical protein